MKIASLPSGFKLMIRLCSRSGSKPTNLDITFKDGKIIRVKLLGFTKIELPDNYDSEDILSASVPIE